jgi:heme/copper-type cytochrome/quinol oxidase subunit 2
MKLTARTLGALLIGTGVCLVAGPAAVRLFAAPVAQDQAPNRREFTLNAGDYRFSPNRLEVSQDDLVKLTIRSTDIAYSVTIDEYRISKRVPAGGETTLEFRADRPGTFAFYSNLTTDSRHAAMRGQLVVRPR